MQNDFSRVISCKLAPSSACYLRSGDHSRRVVEKTKCEYTDRIGDVVEFIFKFNYKSGKCSVIVHDLPTEVR